MCFTSAAGVPHRSSVRALLISVLLAGAIIPARAQQQEPKLLDRLLKPNMSLENKSYDKQLDAGGATLDKKGAHEDVLRS
jgi:hypothetical protein